MFQSQQTPSFTTLNSILQKMLDYLAFQPNNSLNLDNYVLTPLLAQNPPQQTNQLIQVTIPLLQHKKIHWTLSLEQETDFLSIRIATGARINHCQLILTITNQNKQIHQIQINGDKLEDNSWIQYKLTQKLKKGQYQCEIYSPDADNQNNVLFLWLTIKNNINTQNTILTQNYGLEPIVLKDKIIKQSYPLLKSNILQWTWHQTNFKPLNQLILKLGTGGRNNTCQLQLIIFTLDWQFITESTINAQMVKDGDWTEFPLQNPLIENTTYILQLSSPDATIDNAIFVYLQNIGLNNYQFKPVAEYEHYLKNDKIALFLTIPPFIHNLDHLKNCLNHLTQQTISNWQLYILINKNQQNLALIQTYQQQYPQQINLITIDIENTITYYFKKLIPNLNQKYCCFLDINYILEPNALEIILSKFEQNPQTKLISVDHDTVTWDENFIQPCFKSKYQVLETLLFYRTEILQISQQYDFSIWQLVAENLKNWIQNHQITYLPFILQNNYQLHIQQQLNIINKQLIQQHQIQHITKILYHQYPNYSLQNRLYANENHKLEIFDLPKVSIIIPNKDLAQDLKRCIESIIHNNSYSNWEIIIVDNGSQQTETFELYQYYQQQLANKFKKITCDIPFNFSKLVNFGVKKAANDIILLLNNDIEILQPQNWLEKMLSFTQQKDIACVGCKLIYPQDHTIQHAGIICGVGGIANHGHKYESIYSQGYCNRLEHPSYYSAITGACMMVNKKLWQQVNGFDEKLAVAFNDVDFCLKLQQLGYLHVVLPDVYIYHYESKSRGLETTSIKQERLAQETQIMRQRWADVLDNDPYYNPHLTKKAENFSLSENSIYYAKS